MVTGKPSDCVMDSDGSEISLENESPAAFKLALRILTGFEEPDFDRNFSQTFDVLIEDVATALAKFCYNYDITNLIQGRFRPWLSLGMQKGRLIFTVEEELFMSWAFGLGALFADCLRFFSSTLIEKDSILYYHDCFEIADWHERWEMQHTFGCFDRLDVDFLYKGALGMYKAISRKL